MLENGEKNKNFVEIPNEKRDYELIVDFKKSPRKVLKVLMIKKDFLMNGKEIIEEIKEFLWYIFIKIEVFK